MYLGCFGICDRVLGLVIGDKLILALFLFNFGEKWLIMDINVNVTIEIKSTGDEKKIQAVLEKLLKKTMANIVTLP